MITPIFLPALGETMTEARIVGWLKKEGDRVEKGEPILEIETDKATLEVESLTTGILRKIVSGSDSTVPVGETIGYLADSLDEPLPENGGAATKAAASAEPAAPAPTAAEPVVSTQDVAPAQPQRSQKIIISPRARRLADAQNLNVQSLAGIGTGPKGRIVEADVKKFLQAQPAAAAPVSAPPAQPFAPAGRAIAPQQPLSVGDRTVPLTGMRKAIAEQLVHSVQTAPHVTFSVDVDMSAAEAWRARANSIRAAAGLKNVSMTALLAKVVTWALSRSPWMNASLHSDQITLHSRINLGIAVALDEGLIVPVVQDANTKGVAQLSEEISDLSQRARSNKLRANEMTGGTFTISNLGMYGMDRFTAIINPPEAGILAVGRIRKQFVPDENDQPVAKPIMNITLSADHRIIDGAVAAQFMADLRAGLEEPALVLL